MKVITLMDDKASENRELIAEHGLSYWIDTGEQKFLFDCGASEKVWENAKSLGLDIKEIDAVILSHSHYDHAGGYQSLIEQGGGGKLLYTGNHFFEKKYSQEENHGRDLSAGFTEQFLKEKKIEHCICKEPLEIAKGVWIFTNFERSYAFEKIPERFVKETSKGIERDFFEDEICIGIERENGLYVFVGCSHRGILNMIKSIQNIKHQPVYGVFGGTHLVEADEMRITKTMHQLKEMGVRLLGLSHCTGELAWEILLKNRDFTVKEMSVGAVLEF